MHGSVQFRLGDDRMRAQGGEGWDPRRRTGAGLAQEGLVLCRLVSSRIASYHIVLGRARRGIRPTAVLGRKWRDARCSTAQSAGALQKDQTLACSLLRRMGTPARRHASALAGAKRSTRMGAGWQSNRGAPPPR